MGGDAAEDEGRKEGLTPPTTGSHQYDNPVPLTSELLFLQIVTAFFVREMSIKFVAMNNLDLDFIQMFAKTFQRKGRLSSFRLLLSTQKRC